MILSLIVAASENNVIGKDGGLPWKLPAEMQHFKQTTMGKPVIMGRKTYASIGRPLPKRRNIIVSRNKDLRIAGCDTVTSIADAMALALIDRAQEAFVIGGAEIYALALPLAKRLYLTVVHTTVEGGTAFLPEINMSEWREVSSEEHPVDEENSIAFTIMVFERKGSF